MEEKRTHKYAHEQTVYVLSSNKIVETKVTGLKSNKDGDIIYSLAGFVPLIQESTIYGSVDDVLVYLKDNVKSPENISDKMKSAISDIKNKFIK